MPLLPIRMGRLQFFMWYVGGALVITLLLLLSVASQDKLNVGVLYVAHWFIVLILVLWFVFSLVRLIPARLRDVGWSTALTLLFFIPLVNFAMLLILLFTPGKKVTPPEVSPGLNA